MFARRGRQASYVTITALFAAAAVLVGAQLSDPAKVAEAIKQGDNKFLQRSATNDAIVAATDPEEGFEDELGDGTCPLDVELVWMSEVSSSVYATPLITDLYADGRKDVIVSSFVHYIDVLEAPSGAQALGWPAFHASALHASPLLYDIDLDGVRDVVAATYDGEVAFFKDTGERLPDSLTIPRLRVRKDWYAGINPDPVDHSHPDVGGAAAKDGSQEGGVDKADVDAFIKRYKDYKQEFGQSAADHLIEVTRLDNPKLGVAILDRLRQERNARAARLRGGGAAASGRTKGGGKLPPGRALGGAGGAKGSTARRRLMAVAEDAAQEGGGSGGSGGSDGVARGAGKAAGADQHEEPQLEQHKELQLEQQKEPQLEHQQHKEPQLEHQQHKEPQQQQHKEPQLEHQQHKEPQLQQHKEPQLEQHKESQLEQHKESQQQEQQQKPSQTGAAGVELNPKQGVISEEAARSFEIFEDAATDDTSAGAGAAGGGADAAGGGVEAGAAGDPGAGTDGGADAGDAGGNAASGADTKAAMQRGQALPFMEDLDIDRYDSLEPDDYPQYDEFGDAVREAIPVAGLGAASGTDAAAPAGDGKVDYEKLAAEQDALWQDEIFKQAPHKTEGEFVFVDAHVLTTPAIADIDGDGHDELVLAVSYFYDADYYDGPKGDTELKGLDPSKYVAGGIVVFDLTTHLLKWSQHLDLTTDTAEFKAYIFASPTLVDLDGDGRLEVVVGTGVGFVYVLDADGATREGWPLQMGEVQGQVLAADVDGDGQVELFAGDTRGNVALFSATGKERWERHLGSAVTQGAVAADINADGRLEIVFGTSDGRVHALRGADGAPAPNFPFRTRGRVAAQATIVQLAHQRSVQHIALMSFDGFLYLIDGGSGCAHAIDIGEASYSAVLVDDLTGDGKLQLLVSTMNGNVYLLATDTPYDPLKTWTAQVQGVNGQVARHGYFGVYATPEARQPRDISGREVPVVLRVVDERPLPPGSPRGPYNVTVVLKGVGAPEMNAGDTPVIGVADVVQGPGEITVVLPAPRSRTTAAVHVTLSGPHGLVYQDEFVLSFHVHFHKLLKWLVALPALACAAALLLLLTGSDDTAGAAGVGGRDTFHLG